jgi:hypothetical protein
MANDINMFQDLEDMNKRGIEFKMLFKCYFFRFIEFDKEKSEKCKEEYINKFNCWGNYY